MQHNIFACPSCFKALNTKLTCGSCGTDYPTILDNAFLLQVKPNQYLHDLKIFLQSQKRKIHQQVRLISKNSNSRKAIALKYLEGLNHRLYLFDLIIEKLSKIPFKPAEEGLSNFDISYTLPYKYLIRDLSLAYENNEEIELYESCMRRLFKYPNIKKDRICFLGACSEQLPFKIQNEFHEIYTLEKALTIPLILQLVQEGNLEKLFEFQLKNVDKETHSVVAHALKKTSTNHVHQVIADVQNLPFVDQSMDVFVSHYFSDTLPLHKYFNEIKRCLKPGGSFIHYGPLMYHFNNLDAMYSYQEFKNQIENYGFEITEEAEITSFHCKSKFVNQARLINNKIFLARSI